MHQVEAVIAVPDIGDPLGLRDRAMLELFYSTGLRRGELAKLEAYDLNRERHTLQVRQGKGHKDRVVPVGDRALTWLDRYLDEVRPQNTWTHLLSGCLRCWGKEVIQPPDGPQKCSIPQNQASHRCKSRHWRAVTDT